MKLPPGYAERMTGDVTMIAPLEDIQFVRNAIDGAGSLHAYAAANGDALQKHGRGIAYTVNAGDVQWIVRHYQRGGAIAAVMHDRYLRAGTPRPVAELIVSEAARARGIATPRVSAATIHQHAMFYRADIATAFLDNTDDLAELTFGDAQWRGDARIIAWRATGALLRMCFANGLVHPDLNLRNILVERSGNNVAYVIDLDRARLHPDAHSAVSNSEREHMLARFHRSRMKIEQQSGSTVRLEELRAFTEGLG